eukprot:TRINITY_DN2060_c0_g1_i4.p1 TRINITY_DN2060_c0_g1~~TRINITY_DN2060_c0_g1_i4.p1  ORF type:complete len:185 (-),score=74.37 TRINITY_DN2060_c0_g1_i4:211-765(-)
MSDASRRSDVRSSGGAQLTADEAVAAALIGSLSSPLPQRQSMHPATVDSPSADANGANRKAPGGRTVKKHKPAAQRRGPVPAADESDDDAWGPRSDGSEADERTDPAASGQVADDCTDEAAGGVSAASGGADDDKASKRQRRLMKNREAAQLFRQRQKAHISELEHRVAVLSNDNADHRAKVPG